MKHFFIDILHVIKEISRNTNVLSTALPLVHKTVVQIRYSYIIPLNTSNERVNNITHNKCKKNVKIANSIDLYENKASSNRINEIKHFTPANKE